MWVSRDPVMDFKTFLCCLFAHVTFLLHQWVLNSTAISILVQLWLGLCNYVKAVSFIRFYFPLTFHPLVFIIFLSGVAGMSVRGTAFVALQRQNLWEVMPKSLWRGGQGRQPEG